MNAAEAEALLVESESGRIPDVSLRRRRGVRVTTAAAVALGLALGWGAVAGAATAPGSSASGSGAHSATPVSTTPAASGTVKSVGSNMFTVETRNDDAVTVDVSSATTYRDRSDTSASFSTIAVGQEVAVVGTDTSDVVVAESVLIGSPGAARGPTGGGRPGAGGKQGRGLGGKPTAQGTVKSVSSDSFTVATKSSGTLTVDVSSSTSYRDNSDTSASLADVTVGQTVTVFGTDSSGVVTATSIAIGTTVGGPMGGTPPASTSTSSS